MLEFERPRHWRRQDQVRNQPSENPPDADERQLQSYRAFSWPPCPPQFASTRAPPAVYGLVLTVRSKSNHTRSRIQFDCALVQVTHLHERVSRSIYVDAHKAEPTSGTPSRKSFFREPPAISPRIFSTDYWFASAILDINGSVCKLPAVRSHDG